MTPIRDDRIIQAVDIADPTNDTGPDMDQLFNRLEGETSPYLLQHADNPVNWQPWDRQALARAMAEDKPILLSIGYSACHWCHVMAHESFEDADTAELMNRLYVNIKVDREERPDLDRIYQLAHQLLTRRPGGWPLTVILTPGGQAPIFAGTYFPREPRHGMPSFRQVLVEVEAHYRKHRGQMDSHDDAMRHNLEQVARPEPGGTDAPAPLAAATRALLAAFDREHGGFGRAPKFPHATALDFLLRRLDPERHREGAPELHEAFRQTLDAMAFGGMYDQLGGGFFRYSVDDRWSIPHFEKMLYDNALLMPLYALAGVRLDHLEYRRVAGETGTWALRDMQLQQGGFCASLDADSEGEEGKYYVFSDSELKATLDASDAEVARHVFGLDAPANFEGRHHLNRHRALLSVAETLGIPEQAAAARLDQAGDALLRLRRSRIPPARDDKCLTSWNALMIKALARTGRLLERADFIEGADRALSFLRNHHTDGVRLFASSRHGKAHLDAYLDDYVFLADALLEGLQCRWRDEDLDWCVVLVDHVLEHFSDSAGGGLYFTADYHERLLHRPIVGSDESIPSGNGVACRVLQELGHLTGNRRYLSAAQSILGAFSEQMTQFPAAHGALLGALDEYDNPRTRVLVAGDSSSSQDWCGRLTREFQARLRIYPIADQPAPRVAQLASTGPPTRTTAWVCSGSRCLAPATRYDDLKNSIVEALGTLQ